MSFPQTTRPTTLPTGLLLQFPLDERRASGQVVVALLKKAFPVVVRVVVLLLLVLHLCDWCQMLQEKEDNKRNKQ